MVPSGIYDVVHHPNDLLNVFIHRLSHISEYSCIKSYKRSYTFEVYLSPESISIIRPDILQLYLDSRNELHSPRPFKWYIYYTKQAGFFFTVLEKWAKKFGREWLTILWAISLSSETLSCSYVLFLINKLIRLFICYATKKEIC